eukprot:8246747-Alexandrium_andersonii.AAC.1
MLMLVVVICVFVMRSNLAAAQCTELTCRPGSPSRTAGRACPLRRSPPSQLSAVQRTPRRALPPRSS